VTGWMTIAEALERQLLEEAIVMTLDQADRDEIEPEVVRVARNYTDAKVAHSRYSAPGRSREDVVRQGFGGELAVARWSGLPWNRGNAKKADVGADVEVRSVRSSARIRRLPVYDFDKPGRRFVLALGDLPTYSLVGWIEHREAVVFDFWHPRNAVVDGVRLDLGRWLVPIVDLHPIRRFAR